MVKSRDHGAKWLHFKTPAWLRPYLPSPSSRITPCAASWAKPQTTSVRTGGWWRRRHTQGWYSSLLWSHTALDLGCGKHWMDPWMGSGWIDGWMGRWMGGLFFTSYSPHVLNCKSYHTLSLISRRKRDFFFSFWLDDHVTREKLNRILAVIQGSHQKALVTYSNLDLQTQEAYEMAVSGVIRPMNKSPMLITGIRCLQFAPPEFLLEVQCMHETQKQLRRLVHEIGLELKSTAVCTQVRRTRDGFFTLDDALLRTQWDLPSIQDAIQAAAPRVAAELKKSLRPWLGTQEPPGPGQPWDSERPRSALGPESHVGH
ncbi:hypothetical protein FD755_008632 [Muntiacus reevesi]|uniref:Pseudouridine synthase II N-terminal domain-containing protein n=1 Tax=Muntiacus reevesi TaxID=9886 RepID=A0A5J5MQ23_MUNRE|nr:hypothetical protein FD755_008632 [Muntiacus reevesi]